MRLLDIMNQEQWAALERGLSEQYGVSANVYDPDGFMLTDYIYWANRICPLVKEHHQSTQAICSIASQTAIAEARRTGKPSVISCDAGFCKIAAPIRLNGEFLGVLGLCGPLLEEEVESFYVGMLTGKDEAEIEQLAEGLAPIGQEKVAELVRLLEEATAGVLAGGKG